LASTTHHATCWRSHPDCAELVIGWRIRAARRAIGWTQAQLAEAAGLQPAAVSHFETGRRKPCADNLRAIAEAIPISADYLLGLTERMEDCRRG